jgi:hypothetical protein
VDFQTESTLVDGNFLCDRTLAAVYEQQIVQFYTFALALMSLVLINILLKIASRIKQIKFTPIDIGLSVHHKQIQ